MPTLHMTQPMHTSLHCLVHSYGKRHSRIHSVLDQLQEAILVLILCCKSFFHNTFACIAPKLVDFSHINIFAVLWVFVFVVGCSECQPSAN